jgi:hypothetical protein
MNLGKPVPIWGRIFGCHAKIPFRLFFRARNIRFGTYNILLIYLLITFKILFVSQELQKWLRVKFDVILDDFNVYVTENKCDFLLTSVLLSFFRIPASDLHFLHWVPQVYF